MKKKNLGPLEHQIMDIIWKQKTATVLSVISALPSQKKLAYTTIMTIMTRLTAKGILERHKEGKQYLYRPSVPKEKFIHSAVKNSIKKLVDMFGDEALVAFFAESKSLTQEHKQRLMDKIDHE